MIGQIKLAALGLVLAALCVMTAIVAPRALAVPPVIDAIASSAKATNTSAILYTGTDVSQRLVGLYVAATTSSDTLTTVRFYNSAAATGTILATVNLGQNGCRYDTLPRLTCDKGIYMEIVAGHADVVAYVQTGTTY